MTDKKNPGETLTVTPTKTLTLKRTGVEQGMVRQSFSHGRTKAVVVEKVKRRVVAPGEAKAEPASGAATAAPSVRRTPISGRAVPAAAPAAAPAAPGGKPSGVVLRTLTEEERSARAHALADAKVREAEERRIAEEEARRRNERESREQVEREAAEARKRDEDERRRHDEEAKRKAETEAKKRFGEDEKAKAATPAVISIPMSARTAIQEPDEDEAPRTARRPGGAARPAVAPKPARPGAEKRRGRLTLVTALTADEERERSVASFRRRTQRLAKGHAASEPKEKLVREVTIPEVITIQELANRMAERAVDVIKLLMKQGQMLKITDTIDADTAQLIAEELGHSVRRVAESDVEEGLFDKADDPAELSPRPPVVTIMGHVDHGKTSLLDAIREANVAAREAGGITQHIGAYQVEMNGKKIVFIDTPGHEAFTRMRARGAKVTDIVILVVAADDGVMPQTIEALNHAKAADVPIVVAVNKIDKEDANPAKVRQQLTEYGLVAEEYGGETMFIDISAKSRINIDGLLEGVLLTADAALDLRAPIDGPAQGIAIEAHLDRGRGPVATVLVNRGTLNVGDSIVSGDAHGRVRAMLDDNGKPVPTAGPARPVQVLGLTAVPGAGDTFLAVGEDRIARQIAEQRQARERAAQIANRGGRVTLENLLERIKEGERTSLTLILKGDVSGSVEALEDALVKIDISDEVSLKIIHRGVGGVTQDDVNLAKASDAIIIGFNVRAEGKVRDYADREGVEIRYYTVIYQAIEEVEAALKGMLKPEYEEVELGSAEVREVFRSSKLGNIPGCIVRSGVIRRNARARLLRDGAVVAENLSITSLRRFKDDATEVREGFECGLTLGNYNDVKVGDIIETFEMREKPRA